MKVIYEKYSELYCVEYKPGVTFQLTFEELEQFKEELQAICTDVYMEQLAELDIGADECEGGACKI